MCNVFNANKEGHVRLLTVHYSVVTMQLHAACSQLYSHIQLCLCETHDPSKLDDATVINFHQ